MADDDYYGYNLPSLRNYSEGGGAGPIGNDRYYTDPDKIKADYTPSPDDSGQNIQSIYNQIMNEQPGTADDRAFQFGNTAAMLANVQSQLRAQTQQLDVEWDSPNAKDVFVSNVGQTLAYLQVWEEAAQRTSSALYGLAAVMREAQADMRALWEEYQKEFNGAQAEYKYPKGEPVETKSKGEAQGEVDEQYNQKARELASRVAGEYTPYISKLSSGHAMRLDPLNAVAHPGAFGNNIPTMAPPGGAPPGGGPAPTGAPSGGPTGAPSGGPAPTGAPKSPGGGPAPTGAPKTPSGGPAPTGAPAMPTGAPAPGAPPAVPVGSAPPGGAPPPPGTGPTAPPVNGMAPPGSAPMIPGAAGPLLGGAGASMFKPGLNAPGSPGVSAPGSPTGPPGGLGNGLNSPGVSPPGLNAPAGGAQAPGTISPPPGGGAPNQPRQQGKIIGGRPGGPQGTPGSAPPTPETGGTNPPRSGSVPPGGGAPGTKSSSSKSGQRTGPGSPGAPGFGAPDSGTSGSVPPGAGAPGSTGSRFGTPGSGSTIRPETPEAFLPPPNASPSVLGGDGKRRTRPGSRAEAPPSGSGSTKRGGRSDVPPVLSNPYRTGPAKTFTERQAQRKQDRKKLQQKQALKSEFGTDLPLSTNPVLEGRVAREIDVVAELGAQVPTALRNANKVTPEESKAPKVHADRTPRRTQPAEAPAPNQAAWEVKTPGGPVVNAEPEYRYREEPTPTLDAKR
jgi:hypothetical protein